MPAVTLGALAQRAEGQPFSRLQMTSSCFHFEEPQTPIGLQI